MRVEYHPSTISDLNRAVEYYETQREGLGSKLRQEIYAAIDKILVAPTRFPVVSENIRRCFVDRFPFSVLFRVTSDERIRVLVIRHHRQHPEFGLRRQ